MQDLRIVGNAGAIPRRALEIEGWERVEKFKSKGKVVGGYTIISKMQCPYSHPIRIARICAGYVAWGVTLGGFLVSAPAKKMIDRLITKGSDTIHFGVSVKTQKKLFKESHFIGVCFDRGWLMDPFVRLESLRQNVSLKNACIFPGTIRDPETEYLNVERRCGWFLPDDAIVSSEIEGILKNTKIQEISFVDNIIGNTGAISLASVLKTNESIRKIDLSSSGISDAGAGALSRALCSNESVVGLNLSNILTTPAVMGWERHHHNKDNTIGDQGAAAFARALKENSTLRWLDLSDNQITAKGAALLAKALKSNHTLLWLKLKGNPIGHEGKEALKTIKRRLRKNLQRAQEMA